MLRNIFKLQKKTNFELPFELRGRKIKSDKIIPTVYNLKNMIEKLEENGGDFSKLKQWEQRSYKHYNFQKIHKEVLATEEAARIKIIREHILNSPIEELGASPFDIYIVAYVSENIDTGRQEFIDYCLSNKMAGTFNSANAIYTVGKGDGIYLGILNTDGTVRDWEFMKKWVNG
jgi:hypothetical protein